MSDQLRNFNLTFNDFITKIKDGEEDNEYYKSYENIFKNSKLV